MTHLHISALLALCVLSGCLAPTEDPSGRATSELIATDPLPIVSEWRNAADGCEELLDDYVVFGVAEGAEDLVVAIERSGILCVDTLDAIAAELISIGLEDRVASLRAGHIEALEHVLRGSADGDVGTSRIR
ncbi:MAG: hypothetical protein AAF355_09125 [Myxococcota bacterium]